jgi:hypothetical protein
MSTDCMGETVDAQRVSGVYLEAAPDERIVKTNKTTRWCPIVS